MSSSDDDHTHPPSDAALRIKAIQSLLLEKGHVQQEALDEIVDIFETRVGPRNGARVIAKAWSDPAYKARLLENATAAILELGYTGFEGSHIIAVENTDRVHNMVVCTLCSCYPWPVLGLPPNWYKSPQYRSRAVIEPRKVLAEFGFDVAPEVEVRVWDSNAEIRYLVIPIRPDGSESATEEELVEMITRNSMIGTGPAQRPNEEAPS
jgi:nitrile hydratase subunit alpha